MMRLIQAKWNQFKAVSQRVIGIFGISLLFMPQYVFLPLIILISAIYRHTNAALEKRPPSQTYRHLKFE
jgi:hypothetical protein